MQSLCVAGALFTNGLTILRANSTVFGSLHQVLCPLPTATTGHQSKQCGTHDPRIGQRTLDVVRRQKALEGSVGWTVGQTLHCQTLSDEGRD